MVTKSLIQYTGILMYHGVSKLGGNGTISVNVFDQQIRFLKKIFNFISINDFQENKKSSKRQLLLTFDDGFHNNYAYAVPVLKHMQIPAVFFISDRHCSNNRFLWFSYLRAMESYFNEPGIWLRGSFYDFNRNKRVDSFRSLRKALLNLEPHPSELYKVLDHEFPPMDSFVTEENILEYFSGMSTEEIKKVASDDLFDIGVHTTDHAYLTKCNPNEVINQITQNIDIIRSITNTNPVAIAYPGGDYNEEVVDICKALNIQIGFAVQPISKEFDFLEIPRVGIYTPSLLKLLIKAIFGSQIRRFSIRIG